MAKKKKNIIANDLRYNHPLAWFTNPENKIASPEFLNETIRWFETGPGSRAFTALDFLNLLFRQLAYVSDNIYATEAVKEHFQNIALSVTEQHILTGFIVKWWGGYPVRHPYRDKEATLRAIEQVFFSNEPDSPERVFCKADPVERKELMKYGMAMTALINDGVDLAETLKEINASDAEKYYKTFEEAFQHAYLMEAVGPFVHKTQYLAAKSHHEFGYSNWLIDFKGWNFGDEDGYKKFLNRTTIIEYLHYDKRQTELQKDEFAKEKALWQLDDSSALDTNHKPEDPQASAYDGIVRKHLTRFKDLFRTDDQFNYAVNTICTFITTKQAPSTQQVFVRKDKVKDFAFALGEIWRDAYNEVLPLRYLKLCRELFSTLSKYEIDDSRYKKSLLYKYFISAT